VSSTSRSLGVDVPEFFCTQEVTVNLRSKNVLLVGLLIALVSSGAVAAIITVNSTLDIAKNDDGNCTLREAITAANTNAASGVAGGECPAGGTPPVTINFNISGTGCVGSPAVCTIALTSAMPQITTTVFIDGYTQPNSSMNTLAVGNDAVLLIEIDGTNGNTAPALSFQGAAGASTVRGLVINRIGNPIVIGSNGSTVTVTGNFLGSNPAGTAIPGTVPTGESVRANGGSNTIGGPAPAARNLMVGDFNNGVAGINLNAGDANLVQGNYIGTNAAGTAKLGTSLSDGILVHTNNNQIGGVGAAGNVIAVNDGRGIFLIAATGNTVEGNLIGTNAAGTAGLSTGNSVGITGLNTAAGNVIGGTAAGQGNVISGNNFGITLINVGPDWLIQNNKIGTDITGTLDVHNGQCGIIADSGGGTIGGQVAGSANVIRFNEAQGVNIAGGTGWTVSENSIFGNGGLGISFSGSCSSGALPTANDSDDADPGANNLQNYPLISTVTIGPKTMAHVSGSLNSTTSTTFHLEFFANAGCDASHNGQGKIFIGSTDVTTSPNDVAFGPIDIPVLADRHVITATATKLVGAGLMPGDTSEFAECSTQDTIFSDAYEGD
jgi:CSLREA domain-containing protein